MSHAWTWIPRSLAVGLLVTLAACSDGPGPSEPPGIAAVTVNLGPESGGGGSGTIVAVLDVTTGFPIDGATVILNGVRVPYDAPSMLYVAPGAPGPGEEVNLSVSVGGRTYTAAGRQFEIFPSITSPAPFATWPGACENAVAWTGGAPEAGSTYQVLIVDEDGTTLFNYPAPPDQRSLSIGAGTLSAGERTLVVALESPAIPVAGAVAGSSLVIMGGGAAPVTVAPTPYRAITIWPRGPGVVPGGTRQLLAITERCDPLDPGLPLDVTQRATWRIADGAVATVSNADGTRGLLTGIADGLSTVSVEFAGARGEAPVGVRSFARQALPLDFGDLRSVTWTGTLLVGVGSSGRVATSPDGASWTARTSGTSTDFASVASSPQAIVALGYSMPPVVYRSVDAITWTEVPVPADGWLSAVAWMGTRFVAVGAGGSIVTSPDGLDWTRSSSGTDAVLTGVAWSGTRVVAVGRTVGDPAVPRVTTSTDGVTWTAVTTTPGGGWFVDVAFGPAGFVAVGDGEAIASPDGITWTILPGLRDASSIAGSAGGYVASGNLEGIITSRDGGAWIHYEDAQVSGRDAAFPPGEAVIVGGWGEVLTTPW